MAWDVSRATLQGQDEQDWNVQDWNVQDWNVQDRDGETTQGM